MERSRFYRVKRLGASAMFVHLLSARSASVVKKTGAEAPIFQLLVWILEAVRDARTQSIIAFAGGTDDTWNSNRLARQEDIVVVAEIAVSAV